MIPVDNFPRNVLCAPAQTLSKTVISRKAAPLLSAKEMCKKICTEQVAHNVRYVN